MEIDIKTAARMLGTSEATLRRWARQGKIPTAEKFETYVFRKEDLCKWARERNIPLIDDSVIKSPTVEIKEIPLSECMIRGKVFFGIRGETPEDVIAVASRLIPLPNTVDRKLLLDRLLQREALASTGIGNGIAVPHPRYPIEDIPAGGMITTCFLEKEIDFHAIDNQPVFVLFIILSPDTKTHLRILSRLSFCLKDNGFIQFLRQQPSPEALFEKVHNIEQKINRSDDRNKRNIILP
ncbi:MAG: PTS sugar transporter subunit IIA [Deltaproteobacteria bacterium]|nr:PTS sugar transporter subunit IIA [Deltaproteobacteria bacterium]